MNILLGSSNDRRSSSPSPVKDPEDSDDHDNSFGRKGGDTNYKMNDTSESKRPSTESCLNYSRRSPTGSPSPRRSRSSSEETVHHRVDSVSAPRNSRKSSCSSPADENSRQSLRDAKPGSSYSSKSLYVILNNRLLLI